MTTIYVVDLPSLVEDRCSLAELLELLRAAKRVKGFEFYIPEDVFKEFLVKLLDRSEDQRLVKEVSEVLSVVEPRSREVKIPASTLAEYVKRLAERFRERGGKVVEEVSEELLGLEVALLAYELQARVVSCRRSAIEACEVLGVPCIGEEELRAIAEAKPTR